MNIFDAVPLDVKYGGKNMCSLDTVIAVAGVFLSLGSDSFVIKEAGIKGSHAYAKVEPRNDVVEDILIKTIEERYTIDLSLVQTELDMAVNSPGSGWRPSEEGTAKPKKEKPLQGGGVNERNSGTQL